jgi:hypothetical protein
MENFSQNVLNNDGILNRYTINLIYKKMFIFLPEQIDAQGFELVFKTFFNPIK